ncbi:MAG: aspartate kinase, partial [Pseudomonadota bacterium]
MARNVLKFGGTSVADLERIDHVADIVAARARDGENLAVIVSAMSGETNKLVGLAKGAAGDAIEPDAFNDEYDVVVSSGEQVTSGLLALALRKRGLRARSWLGWQLAMKTTDAHSSARIE